MLSFVVLSLVTVTDNYPAPFDCRCGLKLALIFFTLFLHQIILS